MAEIKEVCDIPADLEEELIEEMVTARATKMTKVNEQVVMKINSTWH